MGVTDSTINFKLYDVQQRVSVLCIIIPPPNEVVFVAMGRRLSIFSDVTLKMAAWKPFCFFRFPDSNFSLTLNVRSQLHWHITYVYGKKPIDIQRCHF